MDSTVADRLTVVIVEDDSDSRLLKQRLLAPHYNALVVASGAEMRETIESHDGAIAAVVLDMDLASESEDGLTLARWLRQREGMHDTPIIAITAHQFRYSERDVIDAGCTAYLAKPFLGKVLRSLLGELIAERGFPTT